MSRVLPIRNRNAFRTPEAASTIQSNGRLEQRKRIRGLSLLAAHKTACLDQPLLVSGCAATNPRVHSAPREAGIACYGKGANHTVFVALHSSTWPKHPPSLGESLQDKPTPNRPTNQWSPDCRTTPTPLLYIVEALVKRRNPSRVKSLWETSADVRLLGATKADARDHRDLPDCNSSEQETATSCSHQGPPTRPSHLSRPDDFTRDPPCGGWRTLATADTQRRHWISLANTDEAIC